MIGVISRKLRLPVKMAVSSMYVIWVMRMLISVLRN